MCCREVTEDSYRDLQAQIQDQLAKHTETIASLKTQTLLTHEEQKELEQRVRDHGIIAYFHSPDSELALECFPGE